MHCQFFLRFVYFYRFPLQFRGRQLLRRGKLPSFFLLFIKCLEGASYVLTKQKSRSNARKKCAGEGSNFRVKQTRKWVLKSEKQETGEEGELTANSIEDTHVRLEEHAFLDSEKGMHILTWLKHREKKINATSARNPVEHKQSRRYH